MRVVVRGADVGGAQRSDRGRSKMGGRVRADAELLAVVVGEARDQVLAGIPRESTQAEGGEPARLLDLAEDRLGDGLAAGAESVGVRLTEREAHRAGGPAVLGLEQPVDFAGLEPAGAERAGRTHADTPAPESRTGRAGDTASRPSVGVGS